MKGYQALADAFVSEGVTDVLGLMGDANLHWIDALDRCGVRTVEARHEPATRFTRVPTRAAREATELGRPLRNDLPRVDCPVLLVTGRGSCANPADAEAVAGRLAGRLQRIALRTATEQWLEPATAFVVSSVATNSSTRRAG
jgi:hypothetical protein